MTDALLQPLLPKIENKIREVMTAQRLPGVAVGIVRGQELAWARGFGFADIASERAPDAATLFRCGSITKTFTATAIMQLRDEGRLFLDDPIIRYIPEFKSVRVKIGRLEDVTLRRLLSHHSGLMGEGPASGWDTGIFPGIDQMVEDLARADVVIGPHRAFKYSNYGYAMLGEVVTRVREMPYVEYVRMHLLKPLGMNSSCFELDDSAQAKTAAGYTISFLQDLPSVAIHPHLNGFTAAGQLYSSVADLAKWISLQFRTDASKREGAQVLKGDSLSEMHRPQHVDDSWNEGYGIAWMATRRGENIFHLHGGGIYGFLTLVMFNKPYKLGAIVLTNSAGHTANAEIAFDILETLIPAVRDSRVIPELAKPAPTPEAHKRLVGRYLWPEMGVLLYVVSRGGQLFADHLFAASPGMQAVRTKLTPTENPYVFIAEDMRAAGEPVEFQAAADGTVTGCLWARAFPGKKIAGGIE
jgi:D-alanyl-D-alanine carboxypeptidase